MIGINSWHFGSHNSVELRGPVDEAGPTVITSGTCIANLFQDRKDTQTRTAVAASTTIPVQDARPFVVGDHILVWGNSQEWVDGGLLVSKSNDNRTLTVTNAVTAAIDHRVSAVLGDGTPLSYQITLSAYNASNAAVGTFDWGFRGQVPPTQPRIEVGMPVRVEIRLVDGSSQRLVRVFVTQVLGGT